jgi:purine-nucleoside phosphorylase
VWDRVEEAAAVLRGRCGAPPQAAVVLGSGLGEFSERLLDTVSTSYGNLPHWPVPSAVGHEGRIVVGTIGGKRIAVLSGRVHFYEGHEAEQVIFATRVVGRLGVKQFILTNAAGGINAQFTDGALMVIDDHINLLGRNPLTGPNDERFGPRFPDMTEVYSTRLRSIADEVARARRIPLAHGIYVAVQGPSYETPAEIRFLRTMGADAVGMSTVPEAIAARHMGIEVLGISCITNMAAGLSGHALDHQDVIATAHRVREAFIGLLEGVIERL